MNFILTLTQRYDNVFKINLKIFNETIEFLENSIIIILNLRSKKLFLYYEKFIREYFNLFRNAQISFRIIFVYFSLNIRKIL